MVQIDVLTHKRDPICFIRDQICGVFMGLWAKTKRFWIWGMWQEDVWHLKFRSSEICIWCHVSEFQFQKLGKLKKTKRLGRILPSGCRLSYHRLQSLSSELQNLPWFRSVDLGFGCCGFWFEFRVLGEFLLEFVELGFRITIGFKSSFRVRFRLEVLFFCGLLLVWISSALGYLWKPDALPSAFWK